MTIQVSGTVASGFEPVAEAFAAGFEGLPDVGSALCVRQDGAVVVDIWAGTADTRTGRPWEADTPTVVFSCTKGIVGILAAQLVSEGKLDYDAPVARYWPEYAANGKERTTVAEALSHRAGLSAPRIDITADEVLDWGRMTSILAAQEPLWEPGTGHAYHALTHGWINGEIIRRVTGKSVGTVLAERIAKPLLADVTIGKPETLRVPPAFIQVDPTLSDYWRDEAEKPAPNWALRAMTLGGAMHPDLATPDGAFNDPKLQAAEIPGAGGIASARALATLWSATVVETGGVRLLDDAILVRAAEPQSFGPHVFDSPEPYCTWSRGFQLDSAARRYLTEKSFGHDGAGGQSGFADPTHRVGFGFVTNWMKGPDDTRATRVIDALRSVIS